MHLIVGLGNIGEKSQYTRHNVGFMVIDKMTKNHTTSKIHAIKEYYKINLEDIIVIHDDLDLPFGTVKFKIGGGHGGHNGLRSLDAHITKEYIRVRIGIGKPSDKGDVANYVLSNFSKEEMNKLVDIIDHTIKAIEALKNEDIDLVKSKYTLK